MQAIKIIIPDENIPEHKREVTPTFTIGEREVTLQKVIIHQNPSKKGITNISMWILKVVNPPG